MAQIADGKTNSEIAHDLDISLDGVKWHIREIFVKLDARSRDEAVEAWRHQTKRGLLSRMPALAFIAAVAVAAVGLGVAWLLAGSNQPSTTGPDSDLRVLIAQTLAPEPGFRVIDLPDETERTFIEELGEVGAVYLSPTGDNVVAHIPGDPGKLVYMSYPDGEYTLVTLDGSRPFASLYWSPDGTRVAATDDHLRIYTAAGELVGEHPGRTLVTPDPQGTAPRDSPWSPDSTRILSGDEVVSVLDRDGNVVQEMTQEFMNPDGLQTSGMITWLGSEPRVLFTVAFEVTGEPGPVQRVEFIRIDVGQPVPLVTRVDSLPPGEDLRFLRAPPRSAPALLEQIDARVKGDMRSAWEVSLGEAGWAVSFEARERGRFETKTFPVMLQVGDIAYDFISPFEVSGIPGKTDIVALGATKADRTIPALDVGDCPMSEGYCGASVYYKNLLLAGEIEVVFDRASPSPMPCRVRFGADREDDPCFTSISGITRFLFQLANGLVDPLALGQTATLLEFRVALGQVSARMRAATADASDEYGPGNARIVGFSCREPNEVELAPCAVPTGFNVTWIETHGDSFRRVAAIFVMPYDRISGLLMLENPSDVELVLTAETDDYGRSFVLWSLPDDQ